MLNKEKYAKEIVEIACKGCNFAVDKNTKQICECKSNNSVCNECMFLSHNVSCVINKHDWCNSEYKEPKEFTQEEKDLIRLLDKVKWVARDKDGALHGYEEKAIKEQFIWGKFAFIIFDKATNLQFNAIQWEDSEPTSREEILGEV